MYFRHDFVSPWYLKSILVAFKVKINKTNREPVQLCPWHLKMSCLFAPWLLCLGCYICYIHMIVVCWVLCLVQFYIIGSWQICRPRSLSPSARVSILSSPGSPSDPVPCILPPGSGSGSGVCSGYARSTADYAGPAHTRPEKMEHALTNKQWNFCIYAIPMSNKLLWDIKVILQGRHYNCMDCFLWALL